MDVDVLAMQLSDLTLSATAARQPMPTPKPLNDLRRLPPEIRLIIFDYVLGIKRHTNHLWLRTAPPIIPTIPAIPAAPVAPIIPGASAASPATPATPATPVPPTTQAPIRPPKTEILAVMSTPALLAALRASSTLDLYGEALEVFYAKNAFVLNVISFRSFVRLKAETVKLIKQLLIDIDVRAPSDITKNDTVDFFHLFNDPSSNITKTTGLQKVIIWANSDELALYSLILNVAKNWVNLRVLTLLDNNWGTVEGVDHETQMLEFLKQWLKMQDHTNNWEYFAPRMPPPPQIPHRVTKWANCLSQWMAPKDKHHRYTVHLIESVKQSGGS